MNRWVSGSRCNKSKEGEVAQEKLWRCNNFALKHFLYCQRTFYTFATHLLFIIALWLKKRYLSYKLVGEAPTFPQELHQFRNWVQKVIKSTLCRTQHLQHLFHMVDGEENLSGHFRVLLSNLIPISSHFDSTQPILFHNHLSLFLPLLCLF